MKIFISFVKSTTIFFNTLKMNINVGVIWGSSSRVCVSVNYVILYKLFRVTLEGGRGPENQVKSLPQPHQVIQDSWASAVRVMQTLVCFATFIDHVVLEEEFFVIIALICKPRNSGVYFQLHNNNRCLKL